MRSASDQNFIIANENKRCTKRSNNLKNLEQINLQFI
jgi:hypothetical protein